MMALWTSVREWLRWRGRRGMTNIYGVAEHVTSARIVVLENASWRIQDDAGRHVLVPVAQFTDAAPLRIGDRVEVQQIGQAGPVLRPYGWRIVRKIDD